MYQNKLIVEKIFLFPCFRSMTLRAIY